MNIVIERYVDGFYYVNSHDDNAYLSLKSKISSSLVFDYFHIYFWLAKDMGDTGEGNYYFIRDGKKIRELDSRSQKHYDAHLELVRKEVERFNENN